MLPRTTSPDACRLREDQPGKWPPPLRPEDDQGTDIGGRGCLGLSRRLSQVRLFNVYLFILINYVQFVRKLRDTGNFSSQILFLNKTTTYFQFNTFIGLRRHFLLDACTIIPHRTSRSIDGHYAVDIYIYIYIIWC